MIHTQSLTKSYGKVLGIGDLDLEVKEAEVFGLLGPNGAGKTTTMRLLMGLLRPTKGAARIKGFNCWTETVKVKRLCGYIPGDVRLYPNYTGRRLINLYDEVRGGAKLSEDLIKRLDFDPTKKVKALSKGNRQKLAVILALMHDPQVLILDEPTSGLDPLMQREFHKIVKEFKDRGATILISSHFLPEIERICGRAAIIKEGKLVAVEQVTGLGGKVKSLASEHTSLEELFLEHYQ